MNTDKTLSRPDESTVAAKKLYQEPRIRREARIPLVTAGSFDLVIPNP